MWERYTRGVQAIVYVLDSADLSKVEMAKTELYTLVGKEGTQGIPLLIVGNKNDVSGAMTLDDIKEKMDVASIAGREVHVVSASAKEGNGIDKILEWLGQRAK